MKHVKIAIVAVAAVIAVPSHADITQRDVLGVAIGALIGYQLSKPHSQPQHGHPPVCCVRSTAHQAKVLSMCKSVTAVAVDTTKEQPWVS